jgi:hypothetical protein
MCTVFVSELGVTIVIQYSLSGLGFPGEVLPQLQECLSQ